MPLARHLVRFSVLAVLAGLTFLALTAGPALAAAPSGWETGSKFDKLVQEGDKDQVKGTLQDVSESAPAPGMAKGVALTVKDKADGKNVTAILGPKDYLATKEPLPIKPGDQIKVKGAWIALNGKDVLAVYKIKKDEKDALKVRRTSDGKAYWNMDPAERAKEEAAKEE